MLETTMSSLRTLIPRGPPMADAESSAEARGTTVLRFAALRSVGTALLNLITGTAVFVYALVWTKGGVRRADGVSRLLGSDAATNSSTPSQQGA